MIIQLTVVAEVLREQYELDIAGDHSVSVPAIAERIADRLNLTGSARRDWFAACTSEHLADVITRTLGSFGSAT